MSNGTVDFIGAQPLGCRNVRFENGSCFVVTSLVMGIFCSLKAALQSIGIPKAAAKWLGGLKAALQLK